MRLVVLLLVLLVIACAGCNGFVGIGDLRTGNLDASADGSTGDDDASSANDTGAPDTSVAVDADVAPTCANGDLGLRITVAPSTQFTGVKDDGNAINVPQGGLGHDYCFASGTQIELIAEPDSSNVIHDWGSAPCDGGRRCAFPLTSAIAIDIKL